MGPQTRLGRERIVRCASRARGEPDLSALYRAGPGERASARHHAGVAADVFGACPRSPRSGGRRGHELEMALPLGGALGPEDHVGESTFGMLAPNWNVTWTTQERQSWGRPMSVGTTKLKLRMRPSANEAVEMGQLWGVPAGRHHGVRRRCTGDCPVIAHHWAADENEGKPCALRWRERKLGTRRKGTRIASVRRLVRSPGLVLRRSCPLANCPVAGIEETN